MSESMAFIGGVAVAGLAAILLLKGTGTSLQQPNIAIPQIPNLVPQQQPYYAPPYAPIPQPSPVSPNTDERVAIERAKMENEKLKQENEQLKIQIQQIQAQAQQAQQAAFSFQQQLQSQNAAQLQQQQSQNRWWSSPIVWAVGGMSLTIGGGIVVAGVLSLFSPKQRPRTVQVIHPYNGPTPPLAPVRRAEFLPPRTEARRVDMPEYDDTY
ncbi:heterocyst differentiation related protein [Fischerella thermalis CCMEE 5268]|uniref:Heterocyst differentiation related protein n=1 Tax=Fischerella thermalis CCMEE 5268 TaxID=2019662 RepID=A0A2N6KL69_9CYAN|nr:heterocyst differentiation related protein [Fischerella thermalis]PMB00558.1 heterocyst differentiation related protein [Fischerella thermalis CCMEE 5268]